MKTYKALGVTVAATILLSSGGFGVAMSTATIAHAATVQDSARESAVKQTLKDTNAFRASLGLSPLRQAPSIDSVAQKWAETLAAEQSLYHNPNYLDGYPSGWYMAGENVAYGYSSTDVVNAWINSPGHRANMLNPYTHIGIGYAVGANGHAYYVQNFGGYDDVSLPTAVTGLKTTARTTDFTSTWTAQAGVKDYIIKVRRADGSLLTTRTSTTPKATFTGLSPNTTYSVEITTRAVDKALVELRSPVKKFNVTTLDTAAPAPVAAPNAPTGLKASTVTDNAAVLSWVAPTGVVGDITGYTVTVKQTGKTDLTFKTATPTYNLTGLSQNTSYTVQVTATVVGKDKINTVVSPVASATVKTPYSPTYVKVEGPRPNISTVTSDSLTIVWNTPNVVGTLTGYKVTVKEGTTIIKTMYVSSATKSATIAGLKESTAYTLTVQARATAMEGGAKHTNTSAPIVQKTSPAASTVKVSAPASLKAVSGKTSITATWTAPAVTGKLTSYTVTLKQGMTVVKKYYTSSTKATFSNLTANTDYKVEVRANAASANGLHKDSSSLSSITIKTLQ